MGKRQQSSIDRLPDDIREQLQELLRDPRVTQLDATRQINDILADQGSDAQLSKSAVNRYAVRMENIGAKIRQSREVAKMWIGRLGAEPQGEVGKLLNEMVRNLAFEVTTDMLEGDVPVAPKMLKDMAIAIERLERAASENTKREDQIRKQAIEEAAEKMSTAAQDNGVDAETIARIREQLGL